MLGLSQLAAIGYVYSAVPDIIIQLPDQRLALLVNDRLEELRAIVVGFPACHEVVLHQLLLIRCKLLR